MQQEEQSRQQQLCCRKVEGHHEKLLYDVLNITHRWEARGTVTACNGIKRERNRGAEVLQRICQSRTFSSKKNLVEVRIHSNFS